MDFKGKTENKLPIADWKAIYAACCSFPFFMVSVEELDEKKAISRAQMAWIHCKDGPIALFADHVGISQLEAEFELKRKCGRSFFVMDVHGNNLHKCINGRFFYECRRSICDKLIFPNRIIKVGKNRVCPNCGHAEVQLIHIKSKTELSARRTTEWMQNMISFCNSLNIRVLPPDPDWRENKEAERE